jgi:diacylglycerol kinase (ATP)
MRVTLIHNPSAGEQAGSGDGPTAADLRRHLGDLGYDVRYASSKGDWQPAMEQPADIFVAAGGDGTVAKVIRRAISHQSPVAILPLGTANNVARSLGIKGDWRELAADWREASARPFDVGRMGGPPSEPFVEAVGGGLMAELIRRGEQEVEGRAPPGRERSEALDLLIEVLTSARSARWTVTLDGIVHSGNYLAVEAMNVGLAGPNVPLSATADSGDGVLDVVFVGEHDRPELLAYLERRLADGSAEPPQLPVHRARSVELRCDDERPLFHVDDETVEGMGVDEPVKLELVTGAVPVLVPPAG